MSTPPAKKSKADVWFDLLIPLAVVAILVAALASALQGGWSGFVEFWLLYWKAGVVLMVFAWLVISFREGPAQVAELICVLLGVVWILYAGTFRNLSNFLWDLAALVAAAAASIPIVGWQKRRLEGDPPDQPRRHPKPFGSLETVVLALLFWGFASAFAALFASPLARDGKRFAAIYGSLGLQERVRPWNEMRIGLALSGGGYRAAVFHAGALQALEELGIRIDNLSTVSGGSMIGAYYAVGGDPAAFVDAVAEGRFNLKRRLMLMQNALRLIFPLKLPGLETRLFPWYSFDRLDVQRGLLQDLLFDGAELQGGLSDAEPDLGQPRLMLAVSDLNYGFQLGLLPDGMLKLGHDATATRIWRNELIHPEKRLSLAERVAISGAFPLAFPPRPVKIRLKSADARHGPRELLLVDGGLRDNSGWNLLQAAGWSSKEGKPGFESYFLHHEWSLDAALISDGGAIFEVLEKPSSELSLLPRAFEVADIDVHSRAPVPGECEQIAQFPPRFSPALNYMNPDTQFDFHGDRPSQPNFRFDMRWRERIPDPMLLPEPLLKHLVEQLPEDRRNSAQVELDRFLTLIGTHAVRGSEWSAAVKEARASDACEFHARDRKPTPLDGVCAALALRQTLREAIRADLEIFRRVSTLDDAPEPDVVRALERLGKMLVYLEWPILAHRLDLAAACKAQSAVDQ